VNLILARIWDASGFVFKTGCAIDGGGHAASVVGRVVAWSWVLVVVLLFHLLYYVGVFISFNIIGSFIARLKKIVSSQRRLDSDHY
jgi:hypothetical protein